MGLIPLAKLNADVLGPFDVRDPKARPHIHWLFEDGHILRPQNLYHFIHIIHFKPEMVHPEAGVDGSRQGVFPEGLDKMKFMPPMAR